MLLRMESDYVQIIVQGGAIRGLKPQQLRPAGRVTVRIRSLYIAVAIRPIGLAHIHAAHGQAHTVDGVTPRRHSLVDSVQTFGLLKTADPMLRGEASDGCEDKQTRKNVQMRLLSGRLKEMHVFQTLERKTLLTECQSFFNAFVQCHSGQADYLVLSISRKL